MLHPRDPDLTAKMTSASPVISQETPRDVSDQGGDRPRQSTEIRDVTTATKTATVTGRGWMAAKRKSLKRCGERGRNRIRT